MAKQIKWKREDGKHVGYIDAEVVAIVRPASPSSQAALTVFTSADTFRETARSVAAGKERAEFIILGQ